MQFFLRSAAGTAVLLISCWVQTAGAFEAPDLNWLSFGFDVTRTEEDPASLPEAAARLPDAWFPTDLTGLVSNDNLSDLNAMLRMGQANSLSLKRRPAERSHRSGSLAGFVELGSQSYAFSGDGYGAIASDLLALRLGYSHSAIDQVQAGGVSPGRATSIYGTTQRNWSGRPTAAQPSGVLPLLDLEVAFTMTSRWSLGVRGKYIDVDGARLGGSVANYLFGMEYRALDNVGVGFGYEYLDMDVGPEHEMLSSPLRIEHRGPRIFTSFSF